MKEFFIETIPVELGTVSLGLVFYAVAVLALCWLAARLGLSITGRALEKSNLEPGVRGFISALVKILVWALAAIVAAGSFGIPVTSFVAVLSIAGLALSLSVQNQLSNLFSGVTVLAVKPFVVGDYIEVAGAEGTVREVGLFAATIATPDNRLIHIPNSDITSSKITNYTHEELRRVDLSFCADYECPSEDVRRALLELAVEDGRILQSPPPFAALSAYKDSSIEYILRVWCRNEDYWDISFSLREKVGASFARHGVQMSYGHLNVHVIDEKISRAGGSE